MIKARKEKRPKALWVQTRQESPRPRFDPSPATLYTRKRKAFLTEARRKGTCPVVATIKELREGMKYGWPISGQITELHHTRGRRGLLLNDERYWLAVSMQGHRWIHDHTKEARKRGWLCELGEWNNPDKS